MTSGEIVFLVIVGVVALSLFKRKKAPKVVFVEMFEWIEVPRRPKFPRFLVNMAIMAGIAAFIWIMNR
jgi:hypothetical protein